MHKCSIVGSGSVTRRNFAGSIPNGIIEFFESNQTNSVAFSPQANYTDWATAAAWQILVPTFADRGVSRVQRGGTPTAVNLGFVDRRRYFFSKAVPHFFSAKLSGPHSRPSAAQKIW
jgi:hypothetical protein